MVYQQLNYIYQMENSVVELCRNLLGNIDGGFWKTYQCYEIKTQKYVCENTKNMIKEPMIHILKLLY